MDEPTLAGEIGAAVKGAAGARNVVRIRLLVGKELSVSKVQLAKELHTRFPCASIEMKETKAISSVTVKDIEVE